MLLTQVHLETTIMRAGPRRTEHIVGTLFDGETDRCRVGLRGRPVLGLCHTLLQAAASLHLRDLGWSPLLSSCELLVFHSLTLTSSCKLIFRLLTSPLW